MGVRVDGDSSDQLYNPYCKGSNLKLISKLGILYAWKARALQYWQEKDPISTYASADDNKFHWSWHDIYEDPVGTVIGRTILTEKEIEESLTWRLQEECALAVKKSSDYMRILPGCDNSNGGDIPDPMEFEKQIVYTRCLNNWKRYYEVEGEDMFEKRSLFDYDFVWHKVTGGWYKWDPHNVRTTAPGKLGYSNGEKMIEKPLRGPNIRGRYARDLRGDKDVVYEFTNLADSSNLGSDSGGSFYKNIRGMPVIKNQFIGKDDLEKSTWKSRFGIDDLEKWIWKSRHGKVDLEKIDLEKTIGKDDLK